MYDSVNVVVVTYGNRWEFLVKLLAYLESDPKVNNVIIVDNASSYDVSKSCENSLFYKTKIYRNDRNLGSAGGFSRGIELASLDSERLILLLDDDNLPRNGVITGMIDKFNTITNTLSTKKISIIAYRESQHGNFKLSHNNLFMKNKDFLCFNLFNAFQRYVKVDREVHSLKSGPEFCDITGGAAYGGMLLSPDTVKDIGLPDSSFVLYFDDVEYSKRMMKNGYSIWLDVDNIVDDIQKNYSASAYNVPFFGFILADSSSKIYYNIRNRVYLDCFVDKKSSIPYFFNKFIFLFIVTIVCFFSFKIDRLKAILHACRDGKSGLLGFNDMYQI